MKLPPEIEQLPDAVRAYVRERDEQVAKLEAKVATTQRANQSYSAGFTAWHRERDDMGSRLELAMFWGRELVASALEKRVAELESDAAIASRQDDAQIRHLLDAYTEGQTRLAAVRKHGDRLRGWLLAARDVYTQRGAKPETLAEIDVLLADYDAACAGFG